MSKIKDLFNIENANSKGFEDYEKGEIPFVTNGDYDNAVLGLVKPFRKDKVFKESSICVSTFCEASVPEVPFLARGNGGSGLVVLVPKKEMSKEELYFYASQINKLRWRFSFSRMLINRRIENLELVDYKKLDFKIKEKLNEFLPKEKIRIKIQENRNIEILRVDDLCEVETRKALPQNASTLDGKTPYVTTSAFNNGVSGFAEEKPNSKGKCLTIALNGSVGEVFFQIDNFITSGDNAVLTLKEGYNPYFLIYLGVLLRNNQWRYNYYRKLTIGKLKTLKLPIPFNNGKIDLDYIEKLVKNSYGFEELKKYL
ncbi:MAG: restriction endonuclease subunit S [Candidatus Nanoarchaeia archaeon]